MEIFLNLEISDQKIRYTVIEKKGKGLVFRNRGVSTFKVDTSAVGTLTSFINDLVAAQGIKISRIFLTVNRRDTVVHQLNLANMSQEELDVVIAGEIEKLSTFVDQEFDFIYHEYPSEEEDRKKIVFAAISNQVLNFIVNEIKATNLPCHELEIAPLNVVGLFSSAKFKDSLQALIVVSENTTHLIVYKNQQVKYLYTTNIGQEALLTETICSNWAEELKRALKSYTIDTKKESIDKTWLIWDQEKFPQLIEKLSKQYSFEINPLNIQEWIGQDVNPIYLLPSVPALYTLNRSKPQFSLSHFLKTFHFEKQVRQIAICSLIFIVCAGGIFAGVVNHFYQIQRKAAVDVQKMTDQINDLEKKSPEVFKLRDEYANTREQLLFQATYVKLLNRMSWSETLSVVASELPEELSLTSFKVSDSGGVTFAGEAFRMESVAQMLRKVETSAILKQGKFSYLTQEEVNKKKIFKFGILANMKLSDEL